MGNAVLRAIKQLEQDSREKGNIVENVQMPIEVIKDCKNKLATVAQEGAGKLQICHNEGGRARARKKRYEFMNQIWEGIYFEITERIQELGKYINQDVELKIRTIC